MFYSRETAGQFIDFYLNCGGYLRHAESPTNFKHEMQLADADRITAPTLVVYGYQDYEPITQAYLIKEKIPQTEIVFSEPVRTRRLGSINRRSISRLLTHSYQKKT